MTTVADISPDKLSELTTYLDEFSPQTNEHEDDSEQYWYLLAVTLRNIKTLGEDYQYDEHNLLSISEKKNSAEVFLKLLVDKKLKFDVFIDCLKTIKCHKALNVFTRATVPVIKSESVVREMRVSHGGSITMSVSAECVPGPPSYQWFKDRSIVPGQTTKTLLLYNATTDDTGHYCCRATNPNINSTKKRSAFSEFVRVIVTPPPTVNHHPTVRQEMGSTTPTPSRFPRVTRHPSPITAEMGQRVELVCEADRAVCYDWYKNGELVKGQASTGVYIIKSFSAADAGEYICQVINDHGKEKSKTVRVQLGSSLVPAQEATSCTVTSQSECLIVFEEEPPKTLEVHVGEDIVLTCRAKSLNGDKLIYDWVQEERSGNENVGAKQGPKFIGKTDNIERRLKLKIYCRAYLSSDPQVVCKSRATEVTINTVWITKQPQSIERGLIGNKATLNCSAEGVGNITYTWFKSSTRGGNFRPIKKRTTQPNTGVLYFQRLRQEDWGYYYCQALTILQFAQSDTVCVRPTIPTMKRSSSFRVPLIRVTKNPWSQVIPEGEKFRLLCEAVCTKEIPLSYQWYHHDKKIHGATESTYERQETEVSDCGHYYCEVSSKDHPGVKSEHSKVARIELAREDGETKHVAAVSPGRRTQTAGEEVFCTKSEERYAREKIALLIGNQNYENEELDNLQSPQFDIKQLRALLEEELDFKVISLLDLSHSEMMRALEFFYEMLAIPGVYALFYYSGHGFTTMKKNFLIPINATFPLRADNNICADIICNQMRKKLSRAVIVLDCCRVQPRIEESLSSLDLSSLESEATDDPINIANFVQIMSCQEGNVAYEGTRTLSPATTPTHHSRASPSLVPKYPCSNFNIAFREALGAKKQLHDVFQHVMEKLSDLDQNYSRAGMRPIISQSLRDSKITLHDDVFMDNSAHEPKLERICKLHEEVHYVPETVVMERPEEIGELSGLAVLELSFSYDFTNVLYVDTQLELLNSDKTTKARLEYDINFLERQGVCGVQSECMFESPLDDGDVWGQGESPQLVKTRIRISSIQRLQSDVLKLLITLSLYAEGKQHVSKVTYELPKKPLFANLL